MEQVSHRFVEANGLRMHVAEAGTGPLVLMCHGFPESWYSWRHQLVALADAGFHAVAPDMRGYGQTARPAAIDQYTLLHLVGDMVGLLDALGAPAATIVGHDWGAPVAWHSALLRPDRFTSVIGLSVPYTPRGRNRPSTSMPKADDAVFYQQYFQEPGVAEAELERDPLVTMRRCLFGVSGDAPPDTSGRGVGMVPKTGGFLDLMSEPGELPPWLTEQDITTYADQFRQSGYRGGLNWYRNIDRNWELMAPFAGAQVAVPALYVVGERDLVVGFQGMAKFIAKLRQFVPLLRETILLPGCGHWTQQERPAEVNAAIIEFLKSAH
jgi:pimeloyl-ACP methyl ester carboxylesterase